MNRHTKDSVMELLDRLEAILQRGAAPASNEKRSIGGREALGVLQMIRTALPAELKDAHRLRSEAERLHRAAQDEARRVVLEAQATAQRLVDQQGQDLLARAEHDARTVRQGADAYADQVLRDLEQTVLRVLEAIRKGRELLKDPSR